MSNFTVTINTSEPERRATWLAVYGTDTVPVRSPIPTPGTAPGLEGEHLFYDLALDEMTAEQRARIVAHIAAKFDIPAGEVERDLEVHGVPILDRDLILVITGGVAALVLSFMPDGEPKADDYMHWDGRE